MEEVARWSVGRLPSAGVWDSFEVADAPRAVPPVDGSSTAGLAPCGSVTGCRAGGASSGRTVIESSTTRATAGLASSPISADTSGAGSPASISTPAVGRSGSASRPAKSAGTAMESGDAARKDGAAASVTDCGPCPGTDRAALRGARRVRSAATARWTGAPSAASSTATVPAGAAASTRCPMLPSDAGTMRVGSDERNAGRSTTGGASDTCRCSGGRNAQPAGGTGGGASVAASVTAPGSAASGARFSDRCHGHRMGHRPSLSRVLIAAISCT